MCIIAQNRTVKTKARSLIPLIQEYKLLQKHAVVKKKLKILHGILGVHSILRKQSYLWTQAGLIPTPLSPPKQNRIPGWASLGSPSFSPPSLSVMVGGILSRWGAISKFYKCSIVPLAGVPTVVSAICWDSGLWWWHLRRQHFNLQCHFSICLICISIYIKM